MTFNEIEVDQSLIAGGTHKPVFEVGQRVSIKCDDKYVDYIVEAILGDPARPSGYRFVLPSDYYFVT